MLRIMTVLSAQLVANRNKINENNMARVRKTTRGQIKA